MCEPPPNVHEWISFEDPDEQRTWVFDATYLRSNHRCIYGEGCQGMLDAPPPRSQQGCCSYGAHFVDDDDVQTVVKAFVRLEPRHMQFHAQAVQEGLPAPRRSRCRRHGAAPPPGSSTTPASSSTGRVSRAASGAPCTSPRSRPASARSTGSPTSAGRCRSGSSTRPTTTATSPAGCGSGSAATGARAAPSSTGGAPRRPRRSAGAGRCTRTRATRSSNSSASRIYDLMVEQLERPDWIPLPHPTVRIDARSGEADIKLW